MKKIVLWLLLLVSKPALGAIEAKITQADIDTCRALMLYDALQTLLSVDGSLQYTAPIPGNPWSAPRLSCKIKKSEVKSGKIEPDGIKSNAWNYRIALSNIGRGKFLLMETVSDEQSMIAAFTPRGILMSDHKKIHPVKCSCECRRLEDKKVNFGYFCGPNFILWNAQALYTTEEVKSAWNAMLEKMQMIEQGVCSKKLLCLNVLAIT